jgi:DNA-binding protein H-NS
MDLSNLSSAELRQLQEQIKQALKQRESQDLAKAREEILAIARSVGVPLMELVGSIGSTGNPASRARAKTGPVAPRYRNPADASQLWTGRGRQPKWVKEWLDAGKDIASLKV